MLKLVLKEQEISPSVLQHICLTEVEQLTGFIDPNSEDEILEELTKFVNRGPSRREEAYIDRHNVPYQTAAGCVEALVGTYFKVGAHYLNFVLSFTLFPQASVNDSCAMYFMYQRPFFFFFQIFYRVVVGKVL